MSAGPKLAYGFVIAVAIISIILTGSSLGKADFVAQGTQLAMTRDVAAIIISGMAFIYSAYNIVVETKPQNSYVQRRGY